MAFVAEDGTGLSNANSYVSLVDANAYFVQMANPTEWVNANNLERQAALIYATAWLDANFTWYSSVYVTTQSLGWPRWTFYDEESREIPSGIVPQPVKDMTCELALEHLKNAFNDTTNEGIASERLGDASVTYRAGGSQKSFSFIKMNLRRYGMAGKSKNNALYRN